VFLVSPSSTDARLAMTTAACRGFVYATSVMGVTGARTSTSSAAPSLVGRVRGVTDLPVGVGLGVSNGAQAAEVAEFADAVIVGSALVRCLLDASDVSSGVRAVSALSADLAQGMRRG
jgi:tryptophan synthase alpha chain